MKESITNKILKGNIPQHIAIIMDGNGRWARARALPRIAGHKEGINSVREITRVCGEIGVEHLTLYTFSTENWKRPPSEVSALMSLLLKTIKEEIMLSADKGSPVALDDEPGKVGKTYSKIAEDILNNIK